MRKLRDGPDPQAAASGDELALLVVAHRHAMIATQRFGVGRFDAHGDARQAYAFQLAEDLRAHQVQPRLDGELDLARQASQQLHQAENVAAFQAEKRIAELERAKSPALVPLRISSTTHSGSRTRVALSSTI